MSRGRFLIKLACLALVTASGAAFAADPAPHVERAGDKGSAIPLALSTPEHAIYFAIDFDADPASKAFLHTLAAQHPEIAFHAASLAASAHSLQAGDDSCTAPVRDMSYAWSLMCRQPGTELVRLALTQPAALDSLTEDEVAFMTSAPRSGRTVILETSTARLPGDGLEVTLRASRMALPPDFPPDRDVLQEHIEEVMGTLHLRLELVAPAFVHGADYQAADPDRCVPVDLYRIAEISAP